MDKEKSDDEILGLIEPAGTAGGETAFADLVQRLNDGIQNDFDVVVRLLYRVDVNEAMLRHALAQNSDTDAAVIIARLLVDRHRQKMGSRQANTKPISPGADELW